MHTSTSPQYAIIASCDVSAEMMASRRGHALVEESITEAMEFRRTIIRVGEERDDWWFGVWGPDTPPRTGLPERSEWELTADAPWHGFDQVDDGFTMLDPIKVTLTMPGLTVHGEFSEPGSPSIPGVVLARYLAEHGVVVEKTGLYSLLVLFTIGITKGRWNSLVAELHRFKSAYDGNAEIERLMPAFAAAYPGYARLGLRDLCDALHVTYRDADLAELTTTIYTEPVEQVTLPADAWTAMAAGHVEHVPLEKLAEPDDRGAAHPVPAGDSAAGPRRADRRDDRALPPARTGPGPALAGFHRHHPRRRRRRRSPYGRLPARLVAGSGAPVAAPLEARHVDVRVEAVAGGHLGGQALGDAAGTGPAAAVGVRNLGLAEQLGLVAHRAGDLLERDVQGAVG
nr:hypothetical protein GCM10020092_058440 [Actinoplanes digitatis]